MDGAPFQGIGLLSGVAVQAAILRLPGPQPQGLAEPLGVGAGISEGRHGGVATSFLSDQESEARPRFQRDHTLLNASRAPSLMSMAVQTLPAALSTATSAQVVMPPIAALILCPCLAFLHLPRDSDAWGRKNRLLHRDK